MNINADIDEEVVDTIICKELKELYFSLLNRDEEGIAIYSFDVAVEKRKLDKMRKAVKRVHNWFAVPSAYID